MVLLLFNPEQPFGYPINYSSLLINFFCFEPIILTNYFIVKFVKWEKPPFGGFSCGEDGIRTHGT